MIIVDAYNVLHLPDAGAPGGDLDLARLCALIGKKLANEHPTLVGSVGRRWIRCRSRSHGVLSLRALYPATDRSPLRTRPSCTLTRFEPAVRSVRAA